ncbi:hypothetical protein K490DRAFT_44030 [Saccharata proteae CBS 121410]|uniref:Uncharacterized protein n=1 Tax=Saccharata proteae CBS 121410 TaxID=1314787 RepID=A0A9P4HU96_9PEZI|nr:hypothetical protein K490DRAFT_44030 [Saccharata proteae CBS 121410]
MATEQFTSNDLRGAAVDYQRDQEQKHKWALGQAWGPGRQMEAGKARPFRVTQRFGQAQRREHAKDVASTAKARKQQVLPAEQYTSGESSAEEEPVEASAAPEPDAEITYSYDASRSPGHGSQILSQALVQAIERFEDRKTHELVKEEYEVLDHEGEPVRGRATAKGKKAAAGALATEEDEYEFV